jgi:hypothetical protein
MVFNWYHTCVYFEGECVFVSSTTHKKKPLQDFKIYIQKISIILPYELAHSIRFDWSRYDSRGSRVDWNSQIERLCYLEFLFFQMYFSRKKLKRDFQIYIQKISIISRYEWLIA